MKTNKDYTLHYRDHGKITVPKGTKVTHQTAMGKDKNYHFVDDVSWIKPHVNGIPRYGLLHDVKYYGIDVPKEYVDKQQEDINASSD